MLSNLKQLKKSDVLFGSLQFLAACVVVSWFFYLPAPGYAIAVTALLAAFMSVHEKMRTWQKVRWILLLGAFIVIEFKAIKQDRNESIHERSEERRQENKRFSDLLTQANKNFAETTGKADRLREEQKTAFNSVLKRERGILETDRAQFQETQNQLTGANSYAHVVPVTELDVNDLHSAVLAVLLRGKYLISNVSVNCSDIPINGQNLKSRLLSILNHETHNDNFGFISPVSGSFLTYRPALATYKINSFEFSISARNGNWGETLDIMHNDVTARWVFRERVTTSGETPGGPGKILLDQDWEPIARSPQ